MYWNADKALKSNVYNCFLANISVTEKCKNQLEEYKFFVRKQISETFKNITLILSGQSKNWHVNSLFLKESHALVLDDDDIDKLCELINKLDDEQRSELLDIEPRFMTQGSCYYKTLNKPVHTPPQQIDIDDGVYIPINIVEDAPKLGHRIFLLIIKSALKQVEKLRGWKYSQGRMCARLDIDELTHLDVPMYAVPKDKFLEKEKVKKQKRTAICDAALESYNANIKESYIEEDIFLDSGNVYLAVNNNDYWVKSDPAIICKWFKQSVKTHGEQLRRVCRYLKAWRDYNFPVDGVSSIALMACVVYVFDNYQGKFDRSKDTKPLLECAKQLHSLLDSGVISPDPTDDDKLFPRKKMDNKYVENVLTKAKDFEEKMRQVFEIKCNFTQAKSTLQDLFGNRLILTQDNFIYCIEEIVNDTPALIQSKPEVSENMISG